MVVGLPEGADGTIRPRRAAERVGGLLGRADVVLVGPGLIGSAPTRRLLTHVVPLVSAEAMVVLDAQALLVAAGLGPGALDPWRQRLALTPNRVELGRLAGSDGAPSERDHAGALATVASRYGAAVTSYSEVAAWDGRRWRGPEGGATLATSGSGDVLAGLVAGAAARSHDVAQAACWATFVHARCAQLASRGNGPLSILARDLVDQVPRVLHEMEGDPAERPDH
jgi:ADP-dependent NAD(P)H-hydrate dehydratase